MIFDTCLIVELEASRCQIPERGIAQTQPVDGGFWQWDPDGLGCTLAPPQIGSLVGLAAEANAAGVGTGLASGIVGAAGEARPGAAGIGAEVVEAGAEVPATAETPVPAENPPTVPQNALDTLDHVDRTGTAPQGYKGGAPS